jgi:hypothetical protein
MTVIFEFSGVQVLVAMGVFASTFTGDVEHGTWIEVAHGANTAL